MGLVSFVSSMDMWPDIVPMVKTFQEEVVTLEEEETLEEEILEKDSLERKEINISTSLHIAYMNIK